jgi:hypothetical protein
LELLARKERFEYRLRLLLPHGLDLVGRLAAQLFLNVVQHLVGVDRADRADVLRIERLCEVAAAVHVAADLEETAQLELRVKQARRIRDDVLAASCPTKVEHLVRTKVGGHR